MTTKAFHTLPSCFTVEEQHHMPSSESGLPPYELGDLVCYLALAVPPQISIAGIVLCWFEFIALSACARECVFLCECEPSYGGQWSISLSQTQHGKPTGWNIWLLHVSLCVCAACVRASCVFFLNGKVLSIQSLLPDWQQLTHLHTNSTFMQRLTPRTWHWQIWRNQERKTTSLCYLVLLEMTQTKRKRREFWKKRL